MKKSKKKRIRKSCKSKTGHKSKEGAYGELRSLLKRNFVFHALQPYKCKYCKLWHVGRTKQIHYDRFDELIAGK